MLDRLIQKAVACVPPDWQPVAEKFLRVAVWPLRFAGWLAQEMWCQLRGRAQSPVAPFLWPAAVGFALMLLHTVLDEQRFARLFHALLVPLFIVIGVSLFSIGNFFFGPKRRRRR